MYVDTPEDRSVFSYAIGLHQVIHCKIKKYFSSKKNTHTSTYIGSVCL